MINHWESANDISILNPKMLTYFPNNNHIKAMLTLKATK